MTFNVLSLFSGIGGLRRLDLGLERAGMTITGQVEIDPWCRSILARHWPEVPRHDDVRTAADWWGDRAAPDLVAGGFPCQPVSSAGKRLAQADSRWLWPAFAQVIRHLGPRLVLVENVPGLLVRGMGDVLGDLASLGYDAEWDCVPAAFVGAPHIRNRVWIVAYPQRSGRVGANGDQREHAAAWRAGWSRADDIGIFGQAGSQSCVLADAASARCETGTPGASRQARDGARRPGPDGLGSALADAAGPGSPDG